MAPSTIRRALGAVKDRTSISIAKVSSSTSISDLEIAIVKVTRHNEYPPEEKYIREILSLTCYSRHLIGQCVALLSRRLGKTRSWDVALKTLILIHRLLCEGDPSYEEEIFFATRRGTRMLNLSDFRDTKSSTRDAWDFSAFVRTYARYLDEMLEFRMHGKKGMTTNRSRSRQMVLHDLQVVDDEEEEEEEKKEGKGAYWTSSSTGMELVVAVRTTPVHEMKSERVFSRIQHLMQLLDRFLACRPTGPAKNHRIVAMALLPVIKESFLLYGDIQETMAVFIDRFMELSLPDCVRIHDIFSRLSKQLDDLERFYSWTRTAGIARSCEFPAIERITQQKLNVMDEFIRDRSNLSSKKQKSFEQLTLEEDAKRQADEAAKEYSSIKALPAPQPESEPEPEPEPEPTPKPKPEEQKAIVKVKDDGEADFLNLGGDYMSLNNHADNLALALFDVNINNPSNASTVPPWQAFDNSSTDWETSLVETASHLPAQNATFGGGFDMLLLDGMYSQPRAPTFADGNGSASSVALPRAESAPMLALPAPPVTGILVAPGRDPFAASAMVPAPSYVQMWDMERKQGMLVEEQVMWQNYARNGMQGQVNLGKYQQQHPMGGGYIQRF